jgi:hypothetical protein
VIRFFSSLKKNQRPLSFFLTNCAKFGAVRPTLRVGTQLSAVCIKGIFSDMPLISGLITSLVLYPRRFKL